VSSPAIRAASGRDKGKRKESAKAGGGGKKKYKVGFEESEEQPRGTRKKRRSANEFLWGTLPAHH